jgi:flagellar hook-associated protein 3 FlgL
MNVGDYGTLGQVVYNTGVVKTQLDTLTGQAASGLVSSSYAGLGASAQTALSLAPQIQSLATQQTAIDAVAGRMDVAQSALTQISNLASGLNAQIAGLTDVTPTQIDSIALAAKSALQQVVGLLNSKSGSVYVFGGTDSANPPVPNADQITSSGFYTQIATAVSGLATNGAAATIASTLATASSDVAGTTPFNGPPGQAPTVNLGTGAPVQTGVLANANTLAVSGGTSTTGSYMRDILRSLATLSNLSSSQASVTGFTAVVQDTQASLSGAITALGIEQGSQGDTQASLATIRSQAGDTSTALSTQISAVEDVDMAKTLSNLTQVQTQLTASYKLISELKSLSLANFL